MKEIERKFLVLDHSFLNGLEGQLIQQGYLSKDPERTVRVRVRGEKGFLTIKGKSNATGTTRFEWEKEIPLTEAQELLSLCLPSIIDKRRYNVIQDGTTWEVDVFFGDNEGLIIAEVELESEDQNFSKPDWLGKEVTGDKRYYNSYLSETPFNMWS